MQRRTVLTILAITAIIGITFTGFASPANADVLCKKKSGALFLRAASCRPRETEVDPATLGIPPDISVRVFNSEPIPVPGPDQTLTFDSERWDEDNLHDSGSGFLTANTAGKYFIYCHVQWQTNQDGEREVYIALGGAPDNIIARDIRAATPFFPSSELAQSITTHWDLAANQSVACVVRQSSGVTLSVGNDPNLESDAEFGMVKVP